MMHGPARRYLLAAALILMIASKVANAQSLVIGQPEYIIGTPWGEMGVRLMAELAQRSGIGITLKALPAVRAIEMANDGEVDGEVGRIAEVAALYPRLAMVATPLATARLVIYATSPDIINRTRAEIRRQRIGVQRGNFLAGKSTTGLTVVEAGSLEALFGLLNEGRVDVIVTERVTAATYLLNRPQPGIYRWPYAWASEPTYMLINKKHVALLPRLNAAILEMRREGSIDRFYDDALTKVRAEPLLPELQPR